MEAAGDVSWVEAVVGEWKENERRTVDGSGAHGCVPHVWCAWVREQAGSVLEWLGAGGQ